MTISMRPAPGAGLRGIAAALLEGTCGSDFQECVALLLDLFEERGDHETVRIMGHYRDCPARYAHKRGVRESFEVRAVSAGLLDWEDCPGHREALALQRAIARLGVGDVLVSGLGREDGAKKLEKAAGREFFRLGLGGVQFLADRSFTGAAVRIILPERRDFLPSSDAWRECPAREANRLARDRALMLLLAAFPRTGDELRGGRVWLF